MRYASIEGDERHRQSKKFKQRLKYRLDKGYSYDEAIRLATAKEFIKNPSLRLLPNLHPAEFLPTLKCQSDEIRPVKTADKSVTFRPDEIQNRDGRKLFKDETPLPVRSPIHPSSDEIRHEVERWKAAGVMTELPSRTNFVSSAEAAESLSNNANTHFHTPSKAKAETWPHSALAALACIWLVQSMTASLPGHWYLALPVALAFEFAPMLILGTKIDESSRKVADWGALGIFVTGLFLYLAPSVQLLWNEGTSYLESSKNYEQVSTEYQTKGENNAALINTEKSSFDSAKKAYEDSVKAYGESSWKTVAAKRSSDRHLKDWKDQSEKLDALKAPDAPKISNELTTAAQSVAIRIGLFAVVFYLMFVKRRI